jgi:hypothetical protein
MRGVESNFRNVRQTLGIQRSAVKKKGGATIPREVVIDWGNEKFTACTRSGSRGALGRDHAVTSPGLFSPSFFLRSRTVFLLQPRFEWWVENRTVDTLWVTPLAVGDRGPVLLPHFSAPLEMYSDQPFGEIQIESGERRKLVIDGYAWVDIGGPPGLVVRTAAGKHQYCEGTLDGTSVLFLLDDPSFRHRPEPGPLV